ncbi:hypothetical protein [Streptomyces sp. NPDC097640]|uniref:hypothetical protein n=1 Tax=Streptomyces sp. NPDC097640 TaxID=3157229 RepID=UPI003319C8E3
MTVPLEEPTVVQVRVNNEALEGIVALRFIGVDPNTDEKNCPRVWVDDEKKELVFQGWKAGEAVENEVRSTGPLPDYEAVVRIPARMVHILREACDAIEHPDVVR